MSRRAENERVALIVEAEIQGLLIREAYVYVLAKRYPRYRFTHSTIGRK